MAQNQEELVDELRKIDGWLDVMTKRKKEIELLRGTAATEEQKEDDIEKRGKYFEALTPLERTKLYQTDPDRHQELLDAYEAYGLRRLMGGVGR